MSHAQGTETVLSGVSLARGDISWRPCCRDQAGDVAWSRTAEERFRESGRVFQMLRFGPFVSGGLELVEVFLPVLVVVLAQVVEGLPGVDAGVVVVVEVELDGVVADLFDFFDVDVLLADLQGFLSGAMALHFGGGGVDAQVFGGQVESAAVVEGDFQYVGNLVEVDISGFRVV